MCLLMNTLLQMLKKTSKNNSQNEFLLRMYIYQTSVSYSMFLFVWFN